MNITKKLIVAASVFLILIVFFTLFFRMLSGENQTGNIAPSPLPTSSFESPFESSKKETSKKTYTTYREVAKPLDLNNQKVLDVLNKKLPFQSADFDVTYAPQVGQYIISKKTETAGGKIREWIAQNFLDDIYNNNPGLFVITDQPISSYMSLIDRGIDNPQNLPEESRFLLSDGSVSEESERQKKDLKLFGDLIKTLLSFDLGEIPKNTTQENAPSPTEGSGGVNIQGRTVGKTTVPEGPSCRLTPVQVAAAAVIARYKDASATTTIDWDWVAEATAVGLAESDGRCDDSYPSTNSWGLWEIDAQNARMNVSNTALYDPLVNAQAMWSIYRTRLSLSQSRYGTNWGAYWSVGRPGAPRFFKKAQFYNVAQQAVLQLKKQL